MPVQKDSKKEEKNKLNIKEAREIVLDAIGEKKKEKKEEASIKIDGKFLEDAKKSKELISSKMPPSAKVLGKKKTKIIEEKPDSKEIESTLDSMAKFRDLKNKEELKLKKEVKIKPASPLRAERLGGGAKKTEAKIEKIEKKDNIKAERKEKIKPTPLQKRESPSQDRSEKPRYYTGWHPAIKILIFTFLISVALFIVLYSVFVLLLTRFDIDNRGARFIAGYLPVPALISKAGIVEYYDYKDLLHNSNMPSEKLKLSLVKILVKNLKIKAGEGERLTVWSLVE